MANPKSRSTEEIETQLAAFTKKIVRHRMMDEATKDLLAILLSRSARPVSIIVGPTGVGKTALLLVCMREVFRAEREAMEADPGYLPIIRVELRAPERGSFDWADMFRDTLTELREPLIDMKRLTLPESEVTRLIDEPHRKPITLVTLRSATDSALKHRKVRNQLLDEAQHMLRIADGRRLYGQLETIKSRASLTGVRFALCGTYDLMNGVDLSGQLNRRTTFIHLPAYDPNDERDRVEFDDVLHTLAGDLVLGLPASFLNDLDYVFLKTLGRVGILKDWLRDALERSLRDGDRAISKETLDKLALKNDQLMRMLTEEREGRAALDGPSDEELMRELQAGSRIKTAFVPAPRSRPKRRMRPGVRNPIRDKVADVA